MCGMCSDYVASCWICTQPMRGSKTGATIGKQFYLELNKLGNFCEHFIERYKTDSPSMYEHVRTEHSEEDENYNDIYVYTCEDNCVENGWYDAQQVVEVVNAFRIWGETF